MTMPPAGPSGPPSFPPGPPPGPSSWPPPAGPPPPGAGGGRTQVLLVAIVVLLVAVVGIGVALLVRGSSSKTAAPTTTAATLLPTTTGTAPTTAPATTTTTSTTAAPTTAPAPVIPACDASALFAAAIAKEGFDPSDPSYATFGPDEKAGAYSPTCVDGWAMASVSRPKVGLTDGDTLFHAVDGKWTEVVDVGFPLTHCVLEQQGVPAAIAPQLIGGNNPAC